MPTLAEQIDLPIPMEPLQSFVCNPDKWVPLIPGYIQHHPRSDKIVDLECKINIGPMKKTLKLNIEILDQDESNRVPFQFISEAKHLTGIGTIKLLELRPTLTRVWLNVDINAKGKMAPFIHSFFTKSWAKNVNAISETIEEKIRTLLDERH